MIERRYAEPALVMLPTLCFSPDDREEETNQALLAKEIGTRGMQALFGDNGVNPILDFGSEANQENSSAHKLPKFSCFSGSKIGGRQKIAPQEFRQNC